MSDDLFAAAEGRKDPARSLAWRSRKALAERLGWPDGAVATCQAAELAFPGWSVSWTDAHTIDGIEQPPGFWATYDGTYHQAELLAADREELMMRLAQGVPPHDYSVTGCAWCLNHLGERRVRL